MDNDARVVPLPRRRVAATEIDANLPSRREATRPLQAEIDDLLRDDPSSSAEPSAAEWLPAPEPSGLRAPPPNHRHGVACPQCDEWTWRHSEHCVHCGFNLFEYEKQKAFDEVRRRRTAHRARVLQWVIKLVVAGMILTGLGLWVGGPNNGWLLLMGLACFYAAGVAHKSMPEAL